jgi:molybdopterin converting factor subunit 1
MVLKLLYFGLVREKLGRGGETCEVADGLTVGGLLEGLSGTSGLFALGAGVLRVAVNREYVDAHYLLREGDEVAIIPPVAGGVDSGRRTGAR